MQISGPQKRQTTIPYTLSNQLTGLSIFSFIVLTLFISCAENAGKTKSAQKGPAQNILKGSLWTSEFYHYHNNYYFVTDSTGLSQDGQYLWSTPVDPALYNNSHDSITYNETRPFKYSLIDTVLTLSYRTLPQDSITEQRFFYLRNAANNTPYFTSQSQYAYGPERIELKKKLTN